MSERKNSISLCGVMATAYLVSLSPLSAAETYLGELSLLTDTNAVLNVASGDVAVLGNISGNRGTVTKTGGGLLRICEVENDKLRLVVNEGKVLFDLPRPSTLEKAFFHVDSSRTDTLVTEEENGTVYEFETEDAIIIEDNIDMDELAEAMATPDVVLEEVDFVEDEVTDYEGTEEEPGVEVVGVVWPERRKNNKVYKYDPNGETLNEGDMVLVPTRDAARDREVIRKAAIAHGNYHIDKASHPRMLKKIIGVIRRHADATVASKDNDKE